MKFTDFAIFMWAESLAMVVPRPGEEPRIFAFVHPFQSTVIHFVHSWFACQRYMDCLICFAQVWLLIFIAGFTVVVVMTLFSGIYFQLFLSLDPETSVSINRKCKIYGWITYYSMYMINTMTSQGKKLQKY